MPVNIQEYVGLALAFALLAAFASRRLPPPARLVAAVFGAALVFIPIGRTSIGDLGLGLLGPASAASIVIGAFVLAALLRGDGRKLSKAFLVAVLVLGLGFYPFAIGLTAFDPYQFGFRGPAVPAIMLALVGVGWLFRAYEVPCWIGLAAALYALGAYDSNNLWDYLIGPLDPIVAGSILAVRRIRSGRTPGRQALRSVVANRENSFTTRS